MFYQKRIQLTSERKFECFCWWKDLLDNQIKKIISDLTLFMGYCFKWLNKLLIRFYNLAGSYKVRFFTLLNCNHGIFSAMNCNYDVLTLVSRKHEILTAVGCNYKLFIQMTYPHTLVHLANVFFVQLPFFTIILSFNKSPQ